MDLYHYYSCLAAREVLVPCLPLGQKLQLKAAKGKLQELGQWHEHLKLQHATNCRSHRAASCSPNRCMSTELAAQPSCGICCGVRPCSEAHVHHMLRGRDSPVRNALQECWTAAARQLEGEAAATKAAPQSCRVPPNLSQDKLLETLQALDLAAERLRGKLAAASHELATAQQAAQPAVTDSVTLRQPDVSARWSSKTTSQTIRARSPSPTKRHWIP